MTRTRAIELLKGLHICCDLDDCTNAWDCEECDEALYMAREALESERTEIIKCENCRHENNCEIQYAAQEGSKFFCGLAERREIQNDENGSD